MVDKVGRFFEVGPAVPVDNLPFDFFISFVRPARAVVALYFFAFVFARFIKKLFELWNSEAVVFYNKLVELRLLQFRGRL
jgi:hypothetical protein